MRQPRGINRRLHSFWLGNFIPRGQSSGAFNTAPRSKAAEGCAVQNRAVKDGVKFFASGSRRRTGATPVSIFSTRKQELGSAPAPGCCWTRLASGILRVKLPERRNFSVRSRFSAGARKTARAARALPYSTSLFGLNIRSGFWQKAAFSSRHLRFPAETAPLVTKLSQTSQPV